MKRRTLSLMLTLFMLFSLLPAGTWTAKTIPHEVTVVNGTIAGTEETTVEVEQGDPVTVTALEIPEATFSGWSVDSGTLPEGTDTTSAELRFHMPENDLKLTAVYAIDIADVTVSAEVEDVYKASVSVSDTFTSFYLYKGKFILTGQQEGRYVYVNNYAEILGTVKGESTALHTSYLTNEEGGVISGGTFTGSHFINETGGLVSGGTFEMGLDNKGTVTGGVFHRYGSNTGTISGGTFDTTGQTSHYITNESGGVISGGTFLDESGSLYGYGTITGGTFYNKVEADGGISGGTFYGDVRSCTEISGGLFLKGVELFTFIDSATGVTYYSSVTGGIYRNKPGKGTPNTLSVINGVIAGIADLTAAFIVPGTEVSADASLPSGQVFSAWDVRSGTLPTGTDTTKSAISFVMPSADVVLKAAPSEQGTVIFASQPEGQNYPKLTLVNGILSGTELSEAYIVPGSEITIKAVLGEDEDFSVWTVTAGTKPADLDLTKAETSFSMPAGDLTLSADTDSVTGGTFGTGLKWSLSSDDVLTISGSGAIPDYDNGDNRAPWSGYMYDIEKVVLKPGITGIGDYAFNGSSFEELTLPEGLLTIGENAFGYCYRLTAVTLPSTLTSVEKEAFCWSGLTAVHIPKALVSIGYDAFRSYALETVTVDEANPNYSSFGGGLYDKAQTTLIVYPRCREGAVSWPTTVTAIGEGAFSDYKMSSLTVPNTVTSIGDYAFESSYLETITLSANLTSLGEGAFSECSELKSIDIPAGVTAILEETFYDCYDLASVTLHEGLLSIGEDAFEFCEELSAVTLPSTLTSVGEGAFYCTALSSVHIPKALGSIGTYAFCCEELEAFTIDSENTNYSVYDGALYNKDQTTLICYPAKKSGEVSWPSTVTAIGDYAFCNCGLLTSVTIPDTVTTLGEGAFCYCNSLEKLTLPAYLTAIGEDTFCCCYGLTELLIPEGVTSIGKDAFYCCDALVTVSIPTGHVYDDDDPFSDSEVSTVYFSGTPEQWAALDLFDYPRITVTDGTLNGTAYTNAYIQSGTEVTVTAAVPAGQTFTAWADQNGTLPTGTDTTKAELSFEMPSAAVVLKASLSGQPETVIFASQPEGQNYPKLTLVNGILSGTELTEAYIVPGTEITIKAVLGEEKAFSAWTVTAGTAPVDLDLTKAETTFQMPAADLALSAEAEEETPPQKPAQTVTAADVTAAYGDTNAKITASAEGTLSYAVKAGSEDIVTVDASGNLTLLRTGIATVTVSAAETETYAAASKEVAVTVNPKVTLRQGGTVKYTATSADLSGNLSFGEQEIADGEYDLVAEFGDRTSTVLVKYGTGEPAVTSFTTPADPVQAVFETGENTPDIVVDGLDDVAAANKEEGKTAEVRMKITEKKDTDISSGILSALKEAAGTKFLRLFDISLTKTVEETPSEITDTGTSLLRIDLPFTTAGYKNFKVVRYHGTAAEALTEWDGTGTPSEGSFRVDKTKGLISIYAGKFSIYGAGCDEVEKTARNLVFDMKTVTLHLGDWPCMNYTLTGVAEGKATYTSSNPEIATVDPVTGEVTAVAVGTTYISVTIEANDTYKEGTAGYTVFVRPPVRNLAVSNGSPVIKLEDGTYTNTITGDTEGAVFSYTSSNPTCATVNPITGTVTPRSPGSTYITISFPATADWDEGSFWYTLTVKEPESGYAYLTLYNGFTGETSYTLYEVGENVVLSYTPDSAQFSPKPYVLNGDSSILSVNGTSIRFKMPEGGLFLVLGPVYVDMSTVGPDSLFPGASVEKRGFWFDLNLSEGQFFLTGDQSENSNTIYLYNNAEIVGCDAENLLFLQNADPVDSPFDPAYEVPGPGLISGGVFYLKSSIQNYGTISGGTFHCAIDNCQSGLITGGIFRGALDEEGSPVLSNNDNGTIANGVFLGPVSAWGGKITGGVFQEMLWNTPLVLLTVNDGYLCGLPELTSAYVVPRTKKSEEDKDGLEGTELTVTAALPTGVRFGQWTVTEGALPEDADPTDEELTFVMPDCGVLTLTAGQKSGCIYRKETRPKAGTFELVLGKSSYGRFTFAAEAKGWSLRNEAGQYLAAEDGALVLQETPFDWTYSCGCFYCEEEEACSIDGWWLFNLLFHPKNTRWYLTGDGQDLTVSKSDRGACAALYETVENPEHSFGKWCSDGAGHHTATCRLCGEKTTEDCVYDPDTHLCGTCGAFDPEAIEVTVTAKVTEKTTVSGILWWKTVKKSWQAEIKAEAKGTRIRSVEYSLDGEHWTSGKCFTSAQEITAFYIRVTDTRPETAVWKYEDGTVTKP